MDTKEGPPPSFAEATGIYGESDAAALPPKYGSLPPEDLTLTDRCLFTSHLFVSGTSKSPDLIVSLNDGSQLYHFETESNMINHQTFVKDLRGPHGLFTIRRHPVPKMPEGTWRYTINANTGPKGEHKAGGTKIFEMDTDPGMLLGEHKTSWETRMIFRNAETSELDGLTMCVTKNSATKHIGAEALYKGKKVADIVDRGGHMKDPGFEIRIFRDCLDPLLVVMMAYAMDDRVMNNKRRHRDAGSGFEAMGVYAARNLLLIGAL